MPQIEIPVLNQAPGGGVAMISPANTYVCLTEGGPGCDGTEPDKYYPSGSRNYARVVAHDAYQGAAVAEFAKEQGVTSVYILNDKEAYGLGVATNVRNALESRRHQGRGGSRPGIRRHRATRPCSARSRAPTPTPSSSAA